MHDIRQFYIDTYHDQFFTQPPAWFSMYAWMELLYHLPLSMWAVPALLRSTPTLNGCCHGLEDMRADHKSR